MAWRSSGATNDEMVDNLKRFEIISSLAVEQGFRRVDRVHFVPQSDRDIAHADQPLKVGHVHISAPHIYALALENLDLDDSKKSLSTLNIGSGTGYFSCLIAAIASPNSVHYGIELYSNVIEHCLESISRWEEDDPAAIKTVTSRLHFLEGNGLQIDLQQGESRLGFDRIYIGAAISEDDALGLQRLLKPGGIFVGPVGDELVKISKHKCASMESTGSESFMKKVLAGVRFTDLLRHPNCPVIIPSRVWDPSSHAQYPQSFQASCKAILLCSRAEFIQSVPQLAEPIPTTRLNAAAMLPSAIWMEILSYTHKDWFEAPQTEVEYLRHRLKEEQARARRANEARLEAESRYHAAEREKKRLSTFISSMANTPRRSFRKPTRRSIRKLVGS